jgi:hypothetical protein
MRRSTVLSLPPELVFPAACISLACLLVGSLADIKLEKKLKNYFLLKWKQKQKKNSIGSVQKISYDNLTREVLLKGKAQYSYLFVLTRLDQLLSILKMFF